MRRVLLDEHVDVTLKDLFDESLEVVAVRDRRWHGIKNGPLLRLAQDEFDVLVTMDKNLEHQQNLSAIRLGFVVIRARSNVYEDVAPLIPEANRAIATIQPGQIVYVTA